MTVSKQTAEKVKRLMDLYEEVVQIETELRKQFGEYCDGCCIDGFSIADEPQGDHQQDGEYCNQWTGYIEDSGNGVYYYPIENTQEYLAISYSF